MWSRHPVSVFAAVVIAAALILGGPLVRAGGAGSVSGSAAMLQTAAPVTTSSSPVSISMNDNYGFSAEDYGVIPPGTQIQVDITSFVVDSAQYSVDGNPQAFWYCYSTGTGLSCSIYGTWWPDGTHLVRVDAFASGAVVASHTFTVYVDSTATWPMDTINVNLVMIGFPETPDDLMANLGSMGWGYTQLTEDPMSFRWIAMPYRFSFYQASPEYADALVQQARQSAVYRTDLEARLNLTALIDQRDTGTPMDIFDPLVGYELQSSWLEDYVKANPIVPTSSASFTFYLVDLQALDNPENGADHWFVRPNADADTGRDQNWWRLEWDNPLNIPMGYPMNIFGGPDHTVFIDPTAYEWYLDWTNVWWNGASDRAPYGYQYEELLPESHASYMATIVNDLLTGLATDLPFVPILQDNVLIRNYVLDGSTLHPAEDLSWVVHDAPFLEYLQSFLPFKNWQIETTIEPIDAMPSVESAVDGYTAWDGSHGYIDGDAVWTYLYDHKSDLIPDDPNTFEILTVNFVYDNRSMVSPFNGGREFTGLGGSGITAIFMQTSRLYDTAGEPRRGLTSTIAHETGHNLGYGHQFGPDYYADFVDGGMGYFREELTYGTFWEDALYRVYVHGELEHILDLVSDREPLPLRDEFYAFYRDYAGMRFLAAYEDLRHIEAMLTETIPPVADAGTDLTTDPGVLVTLDGSGSTDNVRVASYTWDFGDGRTAAGPSPVVQTSWSEPGTYVVTLTVTDLAGNQASDSLIVLVRTPAPPPVAIIVAAVDGYSVAVASGGSTVSDMIVIEFSADNPSAAASYECGLDGVWASCTSPAVYAGLPVGAHSFAVYARDTSGVIGLPIAMFAWTVLSPGQATAALMDTVRAMGLPSGTTNSLLDPLQKAYQILTNGRPGDDLKACTRLDTFLAQVQHYVSKDRLTAQQGWTLSMAAIEIEGALGCP